MFTVTDVLTVQSLILSIHTMAGRMVIPVCSYIDNLMPTILAQAGQKMPNIEFREIYNKDYYASALSDEEISVLENAEVVLADPPVVGHNQALLKNAKWIQSTFAGVDSILSQYITPPNFVLTRHVGTNFGQQMGEYVLAQILAWEKDLFAIESDMQQRKWQWKICAPRTLPSLSVGILGVGNIGRKIAEMCKSVDMTVWGLTRTSGQDLAFVDHSCQLAQLPQLLESCDYVCNTLPSTPLTKGLLNGDILNHCAGRKSVLINVGRGDIVSEEAIVRALTEGWLGGAILDVFETEPLPADSVLWNMPGVRLTPHMSGVSSPTETALVFLSNLQRYLSGQPLLYVFDFSRGY